MRAYKRPGALALSRSKDKADAFLELLQPLQGRLERYCCRMLRRPDQVEDVLQTVVTLAFAQFDRYAQGTNFKAWMFRFATLEIFNRNRKREPVHFEEFLDDAPAPALEELPHEALEILLENPGPLMEHFDDQVADALWQLPPSERTVLLLRAVGEFSYQEIHTILSIPVGSVMGYLSRARHKMRRSLIDFAAQQGLCRRNEEPRP